MGNYRTKKAPAGTQMFPGKRGKNKANGEPSHKKHKEAKKGEINYLPEFPEVVKDGPDISQMVQCWPALFTESQVCKYVL